MARPTNYTHQLVVRVDDALYGWLEADADNHGRTIAQSLRWHMRKVMEAATTDPPGNIANDDAKSVTYRPADSTPSTTTNSGQHQEGDPL